MSVLIETGDLDEARALCSSFFYPLNLDLIGPADGFRFSVTGGRTGPISIGEVHHGSELRISSGDLVTAYHVNLPLAGRLESGHRGHVVYADPRLAAVYQPVGPSWMREWRADCRQVAVKIERTAIEDHLRAVLDRPLRLPLNLAPSFDVSAGPGRSWLTLARLLSAELENPDSLVYAPMVSARVCDSLIAGLLMAVDHPYREDLTQTAPPCRPRAVKRAVATMEADPAYPFTTVELARVAQVSVRALQSGFRRYTGLSPMSYLREVRLARVHDELSRPDRPGVTVAEVAHRWGFTHLGRFAGSYRDRYGEAPSTTLRAAS